MKLVPFEAYRTTDGMIVDGEGRLITASAEYAEDEDLCNSEETTQILVQVRERRIYQELRFSDFNRAHSLERWCRVIGHEYGKLCSGLLLREEKVKYAKMSSGSVLVRTFIREQLLDIAASAVAALEKMASEDASILAKRGI